jgi:hypothetical protein
LPSATCGGFALEVYTEEGNWDLVGNNTPVFFVRDAYKFPDFIRPQKRDPKTNLRNPTAMWDFWSLSPGEPAPTAKGSRGLSVSLSARRRSDYCNPITRRNTNVSHCQYLAGADPLQIGRFAQSPSRRRH